jgi:endogenous inhibitor of DNA gyrase (YacG/DUF329 family)
MENNCTQCEEPIVEAKKGPFCSDACRFEFYGESEEAIEGA